MATRSTADLIRNLAIATYVASLLFPPYVTRDPHMQESGLAILLLGWATMLDMHMTAWLANPLVIFCFFRMKTSPGLSIALSALAMAAAHDFAKVDTLGWDSGRDIYAEEVFGLHIGSYLWVTALILTFVASISFFRETPQRE
jgi:hypothetical protein